MNDQQQPKEPTLKDRNDQEPLRKDHLFSDKTFSRKDLEKLIATIKAK